MKVHGAILSPFVRKVLLVLEYKGLTYEQIDTMPGMATPEYLKISPLGKIPALEDGDLILADSSVICEYLEEQYPDIPMLPKTIAARARARWLEEYSDTKLVELCGGGLFFERVVKPTMLKQETNKEKVENTITNLLPPVLDYLESQVPVKGFLFGEIATADLSIASQFINAEYADYRIDAARWPTLSAFVMRVKEQPVVAKRLEAEVQVMKMMMGG